MTTDTNLRSPLARARGLGSAKEGVHHWWMQRLTAIALIPLTIWFVLSVLRLAHGATEFDLWLASPVNATAFVVFIAVAFHHGALGMQVVLEDYVIGHGTRLVSIILVKLALYALAALAIVSTIIVALGG